ISGFAALGALIVGALVVREMNWKSIWRVLVSAAILAGLVLLIVAVAQNVGYVLTINQVPQALAATMVGLSHTYGTWMVVALSVLIVVVLGAVLEGTPALILLAPLLLPVAIQLGFHPLHYG